MSTYLSRWAIYQFTSKFIPTFLNSIPSSPNSQSNRWYYSTSSTILSALICWPHSHLFHSFSRLLSSDTGCLSVPFVENELNPPSPSYLLRCLAPTSRPRFHTRGAGKRRGREEATGGTSRNGSRGNGVRGGEEVRREYGTCGNPGDFCEGTKQTPSLLCHRPDPGLDTITACHYLTSFSPESRQ